jgi:hypothetical protein
MVSADRPDMRLSDAERQDAMDVLSEHVRTGRLDIDEFGTRSAKVSTAKTISELAPLFADLPSPRPSALIARPKTEPQQSTTRVPSRWLSASVLPVVAALAIALFVLSRSWFALLLIPIVFMLLSTRRH